jgi:hypothetical protein
VIERHDHGWWLGQIFRDGVLFKGYFPKNYIREKPRPKNAAPKPPPRPISFKPPPPEQPMPPSSQNPTQQQGLKHSNEDTSKLSSEFGGMKIMEHQTTNSVRVNRGPTFSLRSLGAFDDLMSKGYAIEIKDKEKGTGGTGPRPITASAGSLVELNVNAMIWDGAATYTKTFAQGTIKFIVGKHPIVPGLQAAAQVVGVGQTATVTCSPKMAYGEAGNPPYVPPNSFIVFDVVVVNISTPTDPNMEVVGPEELLTVNLPTIRQGGANQGRKKDSRIILVPPDVKKDNHAYEMGDDKSVVR